MAKRWRIAVGGDIAGMGYKDMIRQDLEADDRVEAVVDVGVNDDTARSTRYPTVVIKKRCPKAPFFN